MTERPVRKTFQIRRVDMYQAANFWLSNHPKADIRRIWTGTTENELGDAIKIAVLTGASLALAPDLNVELIAEARKFAQANSLLPTNDPKGRRQKAAESLEVLLKRFPPRNQAAMEQRPDKTVVREIGVHVAKLKFLTNMIAPHDNFFERLEDIETLTTSVINIALSFEERNPRKTAASEPDAKSKSGSKEEVKRPSLSRLPGEGRSRN